MENYLPACTKIEVLFIPRFILSDTFIFDQSIEGRVWSSDMGFSVVLDASLAFQHRDLDSHSIGANSTIEKGILASIN